VLEKNRNHCKFNNAKLTIINQPYEAYILIHIYHSIANFKMLIEYFAFMIF